MNIEFDRKDNIWGKEEDFFFRVFKVQNGRDESTPFYYYY